MIYYEVIEDAQGNTFSYRVEDGIEILIEERFNDTGKRIFHFYDTICSSCGIEHKSNGGSIELNSGEMFTVNCSCGQKIY